MIVQKTSLDKVLRIIPDIQEDFRGRYVSPYNKADFAKAGIPIEFVCEDYSTSLKGVLRGIHSDSDNWKLVSCRKGRFYFVVANCDQQSHQYAKWEAFILSEENCHQILVPPNFANGHYALSEMVMFHYLQSNYYDPSRQTSYRFDDPRFKIRWPTRNPLLSPRDEAGAYV